MNSNTKDKDTDDRDARLELVLADYLLSVEQGQTRDRDEMIGQHPELANELRSFFANREAMEQIVEPIRRAEDMPTVAAGQNQRQTGNVRVRYFGDYELIEEIARGGMGVVYKARQVNLKRVVALKMILAGQFASDQDVERFHAEAEAAAKLDHPNIVPIFEVGQHEGQHYFSMAFVDGESLAHRVGRGVLAAKEAAELVRQVAQAIAYAHVEGVVHRDLKPGNVLLDRDGQPRVTDFGLAKLVSDADGRTATGQVLGTPSYMPPEQASGERRHIGPHSDIYSLGAILYCLLTGRPPFQAATPVDTLLQVMTCEPASPRKLNAAVPRDLETICLKCLEKEPARRYSSAQELADDLDRWLRGEPIIARPTPTWERVVKWVRRRPAAAALVGLGISSCVAFVALLLASNAAIRKERDAAEQARGAEAVARQVAFQNQEIAEASRDLVIEAAEEAEQSAEEARQEKKRADLNAAQATSSAQQANEQRDRADDQAQLARRNLYAAHMNLVQMAWDSAQIGRVQQFLNIEVPPSDDAEDLRGWEWHYWRRLSRAELLNWSASGGERGLRNVAISPDGQRVAAAVGRNAFIFNGNSGKTLTTIASKKLSFNPQARLSFSDVAFSPDGRWLAAACFGGMYSAGDRSTRDVPGETLLCDASTGEVMHTFPATGSVACVAFSPDGKRLAVGGTTQLYGPGDVKLWDMATHEEAVLLQGQAPLSNVEPTQEQKLVVHGNRVNGVAFSPDGKRLATASDDKTVKLWNVETGAELRTLRGHEGAVYSLSFSPDGERLATGSSDRTVKVWDAESGDVLATLSGHQESVISVAFDAQGKLLASGSGDRTAKVWDVASAAEVATIKGHATGVLDAAFFPDGRLATSSHDETVKIWNVAAAAEAQTIQYEGISGWSRIPIVFSPDGESLSAAAGAVKFFHVGGQSDERERAIPEQDYYHPAVSPDGKRLAAQGPKWVIAVWDLETEQKLFTLAGHADYIAQLVFSPDGRWLASASQDRQVKLWDLADGTEKGAFAGQGGIIQGLDFSADSQRLASAGNSLRVWNVKTREQLFEQKADGLLTSVAFSEDGTRIATGSTSKRAQIRDASTGELEWNLAGHIGPVECVAFSPDGRRLATGGGVLDHSLKLWDTASAQEVLSLPGFKTQIAGVAFSPNGTKLAAATADGTIKIWNATPLSEREP